MLDRPQQAIGFGELVRGLLVEPARPRAAPRSRRASPARAPLDRGRRGSSAGSGRRTRPRECRRGRASDHSRDRSARFARNGRGSAPEICRTSSITPKSSERRHTNGWIASRKRWPSAMSPAAGAGADEGRALPRQRARIHNARSPLRSAARSASLPATGEAAGRPARHSRRRCASAESRSSAGRSGPPLRRHRRALASAGSRVEQQNQVDVG